jgi:hypothetical protein
MVGKNDTFAEGRDFAPLHPMRTTLALLSGPRSNGRVSSAKWLCEVPQARTRDTMSGEWNASRVDNHQAVVPHGSAAGGGQSTMMNTATVYQIRVSGHLGSQWSEWFGDLEIDNQPNGEATLTGAVADQAALHGLLQQLFA